MISPQFAVCRSSFPEAEREALKDHPLTLQFLFQTGLSYSDLRLTVTIAGRLFILILNQDLIKLYFNPFNM